MGIIRPATPGFLCTLTATILLAIVSFCVPYFKSVYFLKADFTSGSYSGSITFGTLGYCLDLSNGTTCSSPSVGYELDINSLVGNSLPIEIPNVVVKWITYALVLHIVALGLAGISALFGLLAHVREMSMTCFSSCVSGFAATIALLAFIFDIVLFFLAKSRINSVGKASMGNAVWLTLAAWVLLFFSGCFYTLGRCCISKRRPKGDWQRDRDTEGNRKDNTQEELRLDAIKAEAERKARAATQKEVGLRPLETQPLTAHVEGDQVYTDTYRDRSPPPQGGYAGGGYVPGAAGQRAVDGYYDSQSQYPPQQPQRQASAHTATPSHYTASNYGASNYGVPERTMSPPNNSQFLAAGNVGGQQYPERYGSPAYEHTQGGTTYHSASASGYAAYDDPYEAQTQQHLQRQYSDHYGGQSMPAAAPYYPTPTPPAPDRQYTLGGDGYGQNQLPPLPDHDQQYYYQAGAAPPSSHIVTDMPYATSPTSPRGPREPRPPGAFDDSPPGYEGGMANPHGQYAWNEKR
ncbi:pali-domain-containing protein [Cylindrobasidium torrendii FP15055 ss-10]|uniref:Pali-domain-containing protein n=1 Tax=Cylindrobasidium torrendii FP15055 ss-10 TaxID=1314674 RepID=A0A0D7BSK6_9AGAR|nr:pali-domain-containing protein [Cylindrobasidium torrendii FP15055 ss-10]